MPVPIKGKRLAAVWIGAVDETIAVIVIVIRAVVVPGRPIEAFWMAGCAALCIVVVAVIATTGNIDLPIQIAVFSVGSRKTMAFRIVTITGHARIEIVTGREPKTP